MFENLKNLSKSMASECDLIKANIDRVAIPLAGMFIVQDSQDLVLIRPFQGPEANLLFLRRQRLAGSLMESTPPSSMGSSLILIPSTMTHFCLHLGHLFIQGNILDFDFDPFNTNRLVCANEDGTVKVWLVPEGGLLEQVHNMIESI